jgi:hypothetical protein
MSQHSPLSTLAAACALALGCFGPEHVEPAAGGRDFALQGEYAGEGFGAQVVAQGGGRFLARLRAAGCPAPAPTTAPPRSRTGATTATP